MRDSLELDREKAKKLSNSRIEEAKVLLRENSFSGAYYLAGYSIELALKAVICKTFKSETIPDKNFVNSLHSHKLVDLMNLSGLKIQFENDKRDNPELENFWTIVTKWNENSRYEIKGRQDASSIIEAIINQQNGILTWIKQHW